MCSILPQSAIIFKVFLPDKSCHGISAKSTSRDILALYKHTFGNADEFSVLEYMMRKKKVDSQEACLKSENITKSRNKTKRSSWNHPRQPRQETHPNLFRNNWTLNELLQETYQVDQEIHHYLKELDVYNVLKNETLASTKTPDQRLHECRKMIHSDEHHLIKEVITNFLDNSVEVDHDVAFGSCEELTVERDINLARQRDHKTNHNVISLGTRTVTISKYVTVNKQRGDVKSSSSRNMKRFILAENSESGKTDLTAREQLKSGTFVLISNDTLMEIIQLKINPALLLVHQ